MQLKYLPLLLLVTLNFVLIFAINVSKNQTQYHHKIKIEYEKILYRSIVSAVAFYSFFLYTFIYSLHDYERNKNMPLKTSCKNTDKQNEEICKQNEQFHRKKMIQLEQGRKNCNNQLKKIIQERLKFALYNITLIILFLLLIKIKLIKKEITLIALTLNMYDFLELFTYTKNFQTKHSKSKRILMLVVAFISVSNFLLLIDILQKTPFTFIFIISQFSLILTQIMPWKNNMIETMDKILVTLLRIKQLKKFLRFLKRNYKMTNSRQKNKHEQSQQSKTKRRKKITRGKITSKWSQSEYNNLINLVRQFGEEWDVISTYVPNKNAKQCMQKFKNSQRSAKKGNWTQSEDKILLDWVDQHGPTKWTECSKLIKGRCGKQCRERWVNILNPVVKKGNWSAEEQELIFQSLGIHFTSWSSISKLLRGRTENSIKNYFYSSVRRLKTNPIINVIKDLYITHKRNLDELSQIRQQYREEISKFNILTQRMCQFLLNPNPQEENFLQFLISVLLDQKSAQIFKTKKNQVKFLDQSQKSNLMVPKENRSIMQTPVYQQNQRTQKQIQQYIFSTLNEIQNDKTYKKKQNIVQMIKYLEMQLIDNTAKASSIDNKIEIKIPCCWNCMVNNCGTHEQTNHELSDFFQFNNQRVNFFLLIKILFFYKKR